MAVIVGVIVGRILMVMVIVVAVLLVEVIQQRW